MSESTNALKPESQVLAEKTKAALFDVKVDIPDRDKTTFLRGIYSVIEHPQLNIDFSRSSLFSEKPDHAHVFVNKQPSQKGVDVATFHFPGQGGRWDEDRTGPQFDGYAGAALRAGVGKAIISNWSYGDVDPNMADKSKAQVKKPNIANELEDLIEAITASGAKKVYLSGRSYGSIVVLLSIPEVQKLGVEIVGVELKAPAIRGLRMLPLASDLIESKIPTLIVRGDHDPNTSIFATNRFYDQLLGPKAMVTLTDGADGRKTFFDHDFAAPPIKLATSASSETFIRATLNQEGNKVP